MLGWSGMRGAVSLAAALAIPTDVPERGTLIVLAYGAVILTLVVPSLTLPALVRRIGVGEGEDRRRDEAQARGRLAEAALARLDELAAEAIAAQHEALRQMRQERAQPAGTLRTLERELDLEEARLGSRG